MMKLTQIKKQLKTDLQQAEEELAQLEAALKEKPDFAPGTGDAGTRTWEMNLARREHVLTHIDDLHHALARVEQGTYGTCENCGNPINPERLEILPAATLCLNCAQQQETNAGLEL
jgi:RNA polymerase-binding protein DksA